MSTFRVQKGFDIGLAGRPGPELAERTDAATAVVYPLEFSGTKQRLKIAEGDRVQRGSELIEDKRDERFKLRAPAAGTVRSIIRGARRFVEQIVIDVDNPADAVSFRRYSPGELREAARDGILAQLLDTGYLAYIRQRPFSRMADPSATPKSIFVNAMSSAPFRVDAGTVVSDAPDAFQAGLDLLTRLTGGDVHLCVGESAPAVLMHAQNVKVHTFVGPHPAGNTSVHISRLDPMDPHDVVWTVQAADLVQIGHLFLAGELPETRVVCLGGPGTKPDMRKHYRVRAGGDLGPLLGDALEAGEQRVINGDILSGERVPADGALRFMQSAITVLPEGRDRHFLGWLAPGFKAFTATRTFVSSFMPARQGLALNTNKNGGVRALVLTGLYDRLMPLNIMVDYLVRAVLAGDTDEAIKLGILETDPEDFALCDFACPCKTEVQAIIRRGLEAIEEEGI